MEQDLKLYTLVASGGAQTDRGNQRRQQLAQAGLLGQDGGSVEQIAAEPGDQTIEGHYRGRYAEKMAKELEELASSGFETVPITALEDTERTTLDGYYALSNADVGPPRAATETVQRFRLSLSLKGTHNDSWRALETNEREVKHDEQFGNDLEALVGVPSAASKVQWYNDDDHTRAPATPIETRSAELGDVEIFDLDDGTDAVGADKPTLLYEIPYGAEERVDARVWDTRGHDTKLDTDGALQWAKLFSTQHDFDAPIVLDNGLVRLRLDEAAGTITAKTWDAGAWTDVGLDQPADVELFDVDLTSIGMAQDRAQLTFDVDGSLYALDASLQRGADAVLFEIPENEADTIPQELVDWLDPIAASTLLDSNPEKTLVARRDVRR